MEGEAGAEHRLGQEFEALEFHAHNLRWGAHLWMDLFRRGRNPVWSLGTEGMSRKSATGTEWQLTSDLNMIGAGYGGTRLPSQSSGGRGERISDLRAG